MRNAPTLSTRAYSTDFSNCKDTSGRKTTAARVDDLNVSNGSADRTFGDLIRSARRYSNVHSLPHAAYDQRSGSKTSSITPLLLPAARRAMLVETTARPQSQPLAKPKHTGRCSVSAPRNTSLNYRVCDTIHAGRPDWSSCLAADVAMYFRRR